MTGMTDATPTIEEMVAFIQSEVDRGEHFTREHPRRKDAPPGADFADEELAMWRALRNTLSSLSPLIKELRETIAWEPYTDSGHAKKALLLKRIDDALSTFPAPASPWREKEELMKTATHYVHCNAGNALFVKEAEFFKSQGGLTEEWGKAWRPVVATTIGDARRQAARIFNAPLSPIHKGEV